MEGNIPLTNVRADRPRRAVGIFAPRFEEMDRLSIGCTLCPVRAGEERIIVLIRGLTLIDLGRPTRIIGNNRPNPRRWI